MRLLDMPPVWVESVTLMVQLESPARLAGARLRGPRGDAVDLLADGRDQSSTLHWWRSVDAGTAGGLLGRQPAGPWMLELWSEPGDAPLVVAAELVLGARWVRPRDPEAWDDDDDGIPNANDPCPDEAAWPGLACDCVRQCVDWGQGEAALDRCADRLAEGAACGE